MLVSYIGLQQIRFWLLSGFLDPQGLSKSGNDQVGLAKRSQRDEADAVGKVIEQLSRYLEPQARFADATGTREGHEAYLRVSQEGTHCRHLLLASNQWSKLRRQLVEPNMHLVRSQSSFGRVFLRGIRGKHKERPPR